MEKFRAYLVKSINLFRMKSPDTKVNIVLGNVSNDMDSVIGSMTLAYYYHLKAEKAYVPVINVLKQNFPLRLEIIEHLHSTLLADQDDLKLDDFIYQEDLCQLDENH